MATLAKKCRKEEAEAKAQAACNSKKLADQKKTRGEENEEQKSPSLGTEVEAEIEQGGVDPQMVSTQLK